MKRVLHIASFTGNIGDNASNVGFRKILFHFFPDGCEFTSLELRKFYTNYTRPDKRFFDKEFADLANQHDLVVFGGGGILSFDVEHSVTGTTIDIGENVWGQIRTPVLITSVGVIASDNIPAGNQEKFQKFIQFLLTRERTMLAFRNDGSRALIEHWVDKERPQAIPEILDSGFFYDASGKTYDALPQRYIAINLSSEQIHRGGGEILIDEDTYYNEIRKVLQHILDITDLTIVFVPHIHGDLSATIKALQGLLDYSIRERVQVAPHVQSDKGADLLFSIYKNSTLTLGTRFHSNVCSLAMGVPTVGLIAQPRVRAMYESLGLHDSYVLLDGEFGDGLIEKIGRILGGKELVTLATRDSVIEAERQKTVNQYKDFFSSLGLL